MRGELDRADVWGDLRFVPHERVGDEHPREQADPDHHDRAVDDTRGVASRTAGGSPDSGTSPWIASTSRASSRASSLMGSSPFASSLFDIRSG